MAVGLKYLDFDYSEDTHGVGTFESMASASPAQIGLVRAEVAMVLMWALSRFPGERAPCDEGGEWDYHLDAFQELTAIETLEFDEATGKLSASVGPLGPPRHSITLSLTGTLQFCNAFREQFLED